MNFARRHRLLIAWMLYAFILFNGLACSIGHGQMMGAFSAAPAADECGHHSTSGMDMKMPMQHPGEHVPQMQMSPGDCAFAGILILTIVFLIGLGWLPGLRRGFQRVSDCFWLKPPRLLFPALNPQAP